MKTINQRSVFLGQCLVPALFLVMCFVCGCSSKSNPGGNESMNNMAANALCSTYFADYGRSSFVPAAASVKGKLLFSTPLALPAGVLPGFVMLWNDRIVVESESMFAVFDASGRKQWERSKFINSPIAVADSLIYYQNENFFLNGVDAANKLALEDGSLPQVLDEHYPIFMLAPQKDDFVAVVQFIGGEDGSPPSARFYRAQYGDPLDMWGSSIEGGQTLQPLLAAGTNRLYIFMKRAMAVDAQTGKEVAQFDFPIDAPIIASADRNGNIYFLGSDKGKGALAAVTQDGVELWRFTDPVLRGITEAGQPPILGAGNTAFLIAGGTILAVREGNLAWKHVLPKGGFSYGAALADGSFLATAGSVVFLFDANGGQVSAIDVDEVLLTPPVVDRAGRVYVASSKTLFGLQ